MKQRIRTILIAVLCIAVSAALTVATFRTPTGITANFDPASYRSDVIVTAFQENWTSIAKECTKTFGPEGVAYVQVSPPQESIKGTQWWTSYQPVSYTLNSKEGTEQEFKSMVATCKAAGVGIIADAVINHTTGVGQGSGTGTGGSAYDAKGDFPAIGYTAKDFHSCDSDVINYTDQENVQDCRVTGLQDLDTSSAHVRDTLASYFAKLINYGVAGFRVDAVKHISNTDVLAIKKLVAQKTGRSLNDIWWMQEVIGNVNEAAAIQPKNYTRSGQVSEFQYAYQLKTFFSNSLVGGTKSIKDITSNLVPSDQAAIFVTNWDTERNGMTLTYRDENSYLLANAFMLAYPYSTPNIFSGYEYENSDDGAPGATSTSVPDTTCGTGSDWTCTQRWTAIRGMIGWHNVARSARMVDWHDDGDNVIGFGRGNRAYIVINNGENDAAVSYATSMPAGEYCNVYASGDCSSTVHIGIDSKLNATVPAGSAIAIHVAATPSTWHGGSAREASDPDWYGN